MKTILAMLLSLLMCASLVACGDEKESKEEKETKEEVKVEEFFEECSQLITPDSVTDVKKTGSSTTSSNGVTTKISYKYAANDGDKAEEVYNEYIEILKKRGFQIKGDAESGFSVIDNKIGIANITYDKTNGYVMVVNIVPENMREEEKEIIIVNVGDTIKTADYEYTINNVELTYELLPENTSSVYSSYPAPQGKVYLHVDGYLKNLMKRDIRIDETFSPVGIYGDGYVYDGFVVVNDDNRFDWVSSYSAAAPLETSHVHSLIEMPNEVETSDETLIVTLRASDGNTYQINYRVKR